MNTPHTVLKTEDMLRTMTIQEQHEQLVSTSFKNIDGRGGKMELLHAILGLAGEVGELVDAIKKHVFYEKPLDMPNFVEEMGDIEYYMEALRQNIDAKYYANNSIRREMILEVNLDKLRKRYPGENYSNAAAVARADKIEPLGSSFVPGSPEWHDFNDRVAQDRDLRRTL